MVAKLTLPVGFKCGSFVVIDVTPRMHRNGYTEFKCLCACGIEKFIRGSSLKLNLVKSCGCRRSASARAWAYKHLRVHGHTICGTSSPTYITWRAMLNRCNNPKAYSYKWYGACGIKVCKRWLSFEHFLKDMGERQPGMSIDRIKNSGNYCKSNCRWATWAEQAKNKRGRRWAKHP